LTGNINILDRFEYLFVLLD